MLIPLVMVAAAVVAFAWIKVRHKRKDSDALPVR